MARRAKKQKKQNGQKPISMFRFAAELVIVLLLFFGLFALIGMLADAVKYTVEGLEIVDRLNMSISDSEEEAEKIADNYESELREKADFAVYLYANDPDLLGAEENPVLLANRPIAFFDENGEVIVKENSFPDYSRTRILNSIREADANGFSEAALSDDERILMTRLSDNEYIALVDMLTWRDYIAGSISDAKALVKDAASRHSFAIAERGGMYFAGPDWLDVPEGTPIGEVIENSDAIAADTLTDQSISAILVKGKPYFSMRWKIESESNMNVYYLLDFRYVFRQSMNTILATFGAMFCALIVLLYYLIQYRRSQRDETIPPAEKGFRSRRRILLLLGTLLTALVAYYARTVFCISSYVMDDDKEIESLCEAVNENVESSDDVMDSFRSNYEEEIGMISRYLSAKPERINEETLQKITNIFGFEYLMVFDEAGHEVISDSDFVGLTLSQNKNNLSYNGWKVLKGGHAQTFEGVDDMCGGEDYRMYAAAAICNEEGIPDGAVLAAIPMEHQDQVRRNNSIFAVMDERNESGQTKYYLVDKEGEFFYHTPNSTLDGLTPGDYGFTEEVLKEGFSGVVSLGGIPYYMTQGDLDDAYIYTAIPFSVVYGTRMPFTIAAAVSTFLILLFAAKRCQRVKIVRVSAGQDPGAKRQPPKEEGEGFEHEIQIQPPRPRTTDAGLPASAEEKTTRLILRICQIVGVVITVILLFREQLVPEDSMIHRVLEGGWQRGLNIYAATAVLIMILTVVICVSLILYVLKILTRILSPRGETICRLLRSAVEYLSVIMAAYTGFSFLGVRVEALITTTSLMVLLVGMGAQDLTADIIAGLFLMFESEFQVGDVIDTGGKIGVVKEIGIHSTKLIDPNNNVLIIANSRLADIVNRTQRNSFVFTDFKVSADVKIADLEELFRQELPPLKKQYPKFIGEPHFRGVSEFAGGTMKCNVAAEVDEKDRTAMERILNREVLRILKNADITPL